MQFDFTQTHSEQSDGDQTLEGVIERLTFHAPDSGWTVMRLHVPELSETVSAVGTMLSPQVGESVLLVGVWQDHTQYGRQFRFHRYQLVRPATIEAIQAYLGGGLVEGIGPKMAAALVAHFGDQTLTVLEQTPERLEEVAGIGKKRAAALRDAWQRHRAVHRIMLFLHEHGVGGALAGRIYARYGDQAVEMLERQPYRLARDVRGIGFLTADRIAASVGISHEDPSRIEAGILHILHVAAEDGHVYLPLGELTQRAQKLLGVSEQQVTLGVERLVEAQELVLEEYRAPHAGPLVAEEGELAEVEPPLSSLSQQAPGEEDAAPHLVSPAGAERVEVGAYVPHMLQVEMEVAARLRYHATHQPPGVPTREQVVAWLEHRGDMGEVVLTDEQRQAVVQALTGGACVITGGPGTGKTTVTRAMVDACRALGRTVALASPTGRAAKRLEQLAGHPASTIHRLLAYDPVRGGFKHRPSDPLRVGMLIVDEASMLDIVLARDLLRALPAQAQLVLIGDADQLPSVGPGSLLRDIVASNVVPVHRLTQIFRQGLASDLIRSAHLLNQGQSPRFPNKEQWLRDRGDCVFLEEEDVDRAADRVIRTATDSLPRLGFAPEEIQVISPLRRGPLGVTELNARLQEALNPATPHCPQVFRGDMVLREGDRVLQTTNNYDRGVFNGDIGRVTRIDPQARTLEVQFDTGPVSYSFADLDELELAYALTVHKSQGSEYPAVVMVIHSSHYIMLQRNLLYTALTRAQRMACIVGDRRGVWRAIRNVRVRERYTRLEPRLRAELPCGDRAPVVALPQ